MRASQRALGWMIGVMVCASTGNAWAQQVPTFAPGTRAAGMGEAFNAVSDGATGIFHNPAGIARALVYSIDGSFNYTPSGTSLSAAIVDSKTNPAISAGIGVGYYFSTVEGEESNTLDVRLSLAIPAIPERISFGIGGRYLISNAAGVEVINGITLDAGALFRVVEALHVGISAKNLINVCQNTTCPGYVPLLIGGGVAYATPELTIAGDIDFDMNSTSTPTLNFDLGAEYVFEKMVPVRLGYRRRGVTSANVLSVGSGWRTDNAGIDVAYQHDLSQNDIGLISVAINALF